MRLFNSSVIANGQSRRTSAIYQLCLADYFEVQFVIPATTISASTIRILTINKVLLMLTVNRRLLKVQGRSVSSATFFAIDSCAHRRIRSMLAIAIAVKIPSIIYDPGLKHH